MRADASGQTAGAAVASIERAKRWEVALAAGLSAVAFAPYFRALYSIWKGEVSLSHLPGIYVVSTGVLLARARAFRACETRVDARGLPLAAAGVLLYAAGTWGDAAFAAAAALPFVLLGATRTLFGAAVARLARFPLLFLLFAVPPPRSAIEPMLLEMRQLAAVGSAAALRVLGEDATVRGDLVQVGGVRLEVEEACSGYHSLLVLLPTAVFLGFLFRRGRRDRIAMALAAVPLALLGNAMRIVATALLLRRGVAATEGTLHSILGLAAFLVPLAVLFGWAARGPLRESGG